jgi:hypothetical protein
MARTKTVEYLDGEVEVEESVPTTVQELADIVGEEALVDSSVSNFYYRNKYPRVYRKVSEAIKEKHPRDVKEEKTLKDGTVRKIYVSEMDHIRSYLKTGNGAKEEIQSLFTSIAPNEPLFVKGERVGGSGKLPQKAIDSANQMFASGVERVEQVIEAIEGQIPGYTVDRDSEGNATPDSLARAIVALNKYIVKKAEAEANAKMGIPA